MRRPHCFEHFDAKQCRNILPQPHFFAPSPQPHFAPSSAAAFFAPSVLLPSRLCSCFWIWILMVEMILMKCFYFFFKAGGSEAGIYVDCNFYALD